MISNRAQLCIIAVLACLFSSMSVKADDYVTLNTEPVRNPMLWADCPDPDVIRVGDTFYMVTTTMHLMPGAPVMASKDLKNWETVGYIFDRLTDSPKYDLLQGTAYGRGQWATSLKYHNGKFYALLAPNEQGAMGDTYIFSAEKAEGPWTVVSRMRHFHDCSLFFDDDDRVYVIYGTGEMMELKSDLSDVIEGTYQKIFEREEDEKGLLEGSRMIKHNGKYYLLMISHTYAPGRHRREVCYRADDIHGPYEKQVILESEFGGFYYEAQGTIVDSQDGDWYGIIFQDRGGVGRVLTVMPCRWINGWPMLGDENGKVPETVRALVSGQAETAIVKSDDFSASKLGLHWQWNHNPIDKAWSLTERPGFLRLKTGRVVSSLYLAPNTLTQRMEGPTCSGAIMMDLSKMKDGDCAGLAAFNNDTGALTVKKKGKKLVLEMDEMTVELSDRDKEVTKVEEKTIEAVDLKQSKIWLRIDADFRPTGQGGGRDAANFYYSLDGREWTKLGTTDYRLRFDWRRFFMGTKFGIFCYATKQTGGYVDIDAFDYKKPIEARMPASSVDKKLTAEAKGQKLTVCYDNQKVLELADIPFDGATETPLEFVRTVKDNYRMLSGKRLQCHNEANEYQAKVGDARLVLRLYNDGVAFRYEYADLQNREQPEEKTVFLIPEGTRRWMQQWTDSYEGFFPLSTTYKVAPVPSFSGVSKSAEGYNNRWGFPALLEPVDSVFVLLSEANIERRQSASCLFNDGERYTVVPAENGQLLNGAWHSPWRVAVIGHLSDIVESTLVTDVAEPCRLNDVSWIHPGVVSWIYWAYNHGSNDYAIIKQYVDMAATLHLPYVLIDAEWDTMQQGKTIEDAVAYARSQGVKPLIWYNSSIGWVDGAPTPKFRLNKAMDREKEFAWCEKIGVAGVKIDFFSGDDQKNMDYCLDLLECAARHHLLVNFHGATIPRGWQRTYPNLLSTEGVYGAEWYNNVPTFTAQAAAHNATLPFTRNVVGPMDYTPCAFSDSQHPHITTHAHELALTVLFESGLQHLADRPESFLSQPKEVQQFLGTLPAAWDETRCLGGYPGEYAVLARRSGLNWYIAGINGTDKPMNIPLLLEKLDLGNQYGELFLDSGHLDSPWEIRTLRKEQIPAFVSCQPRGGFLLVI